MYRAPILDLSRLRPRSPSLSSCKSDITKCFRYVKQTEANRFQLNGRNGTLLGMDDLSEPLFKTNVVSYLKRTILIAVCLAILAVPFAIAQENDDDDPLLELTEKLDT